MASNKPISQFSTAELERALAERKAEENNAAKPKPQANIDWTGVIKLAQEAVDSLAAGDGVDDDLDHWFFESVMDAIYSKNIWKWWNKQEQDE